MQIHDRKFKKAGNFKLRLLFFAVFEVKMTNICRYLNSKKKAMAFCRPLPYTFFTGLQVAFPPACWNHNCVWCSYCDEHIRFSVIYESKVWFQHARVVISIRRVWFLHEECNFHTQYDVETQKFDDDTHNCDFNTHKSDYYTQSVILTRMSVISTR
jgi:hypothetical protein